MLAYSIIFPLVPTSRIRFWVVEDVRLNLLVPPNQRWFIQLHPLKLTSSGELQDGFMNN